jgi:hypothetical protein
MRIKISHTKSGSGNDNNEYLNTIDNVQKYMANYCFTVPFLPGAIELARKWNQENIVNNKEHDEVFNEAGYLASRFGFNICHKGILQW